MENRNWIKITGIIFLIAALATITGISLKDIFKSTETSFKQQNQQDTKSEKYATIEQAEEQELRNKVQYVCIEEIEIAVATVDMNNGIKYYWPDADRLCKNLFLGGFRDWRLPTIEEATRMFFHKDTIGGFSKESYWSSTADSYRKMLAIHMETGAALSYGSEHRCRCVRSLQTLDIADANLEATE